MNVSKKIGWQKYEDVLMNQLDSPILDRLMRSTQHLSKEELEGLEVEEQTQPAYEDEGNYIFVPVDPRLLDNIHMANNFDCWMGHTNFNISEEVQERIEILPGVEVLKVCSRYRFFLGVGRMFDFNNVRQSIEKALTSEEQADGKDGNPENETRQLSE